MHTKHIRTTFLNFFTKHDHQVVKSSSLVPYNDPTLMFTNSGMVQFKDIFTGRESRTVQRAVSVQKCVRAGGKHNDLDNVGYTTRHHTFFEMLGNFSFGNYFKETAIELAWTLIIKEFKLPRDRLLVTVHEQDKEAFRLWKKIAGLSEQRIIRIASSDNFWKMGESGPCGPCSEIFYDHGSTIPGSPPGSAGQEGSRFTEIWNLVFIELNNLPTGEMVALPYPSIDTGMGLERIAAVLQGKHDNYDIDILKSLIDASASLTNTDPEGLNKISHRIIADHIRSISFLIADGVLPANDGRGYVLRRIMRRAIRHGHQIGIRDPNLYCLVPILIHQMGDFYPELELAEVLITDTLKREEIRFQQTLDRGLRLLDEQIAKLHPGQPLSGHIAFQLYDTYGFPLDLTEDVMRDHGSMVDRQSFDEAMAQQRHRARESWIGLKTSATEEIGHLIRQKKGSTEFLGYQTDSAESVIHTIIIEDEQVTQACTTMQVSIIVYQTPFYSQAGGQVGDTGTIVSTDGKNSVVIHDTQKTQSNVILHIGVVTQGTITVEMAVRLVVDTDRRTMIRANHSATHLLHRAARDRLGRHVFQKGSLVDSDRLRFDISHPTVFTQDDLIAIERMVNERIRTNHLVVTRLMTLEEAQAQGAMALFGEKYGNDVRVVSMGGQDPETNCDYSIELCGGMHVKRTGDIGCFKIIDEGAVAAGIRRIEAVTGIQALAYVTDRIHWLDQAAQYLKTSPRDVPTRILSLIKAQKEMEQEVSKLRRQVNTASHDHHEIQQIGEVRFTSRVIKDIAVKELKNMVDTIKRQIGKCAVVVVVGINAGKVSLVVGVSEDLTDQVSAIDLVKIGAAELGGKGGGGRPDMAQAGGSDGTKVKSALEVIAQVLSNVSKKRLSNNT